jgi:phage/plasmid-associated DNA primase
LGYDRPHAPTINQCPAGIRGRTGLGESHSNIGFGNLVMLSVQDVEAAGIVGSGAHTCGEVLEAYRQDPAYADTATTQWALGFMSAMNMTVTETEKTEFDLPTIKPGGMQRWLRKYCAEHPKAESYEAVDQLMFSLPTKPKE